MFFSSPLASRTSLSPSRSVVPPFPHTHAFSFQNTGLFTHGKREYFMAPLLSFPRAFGSHGLLPPFLSLTNPPAHTQAYPAHLLAHPPTLFTGRADLW